MAYTAPTTRATSDLIGASNWNTDLVDNITYLADAKPRAQVGRSAVQSVTTATITGINWTTEAADNASIHSTVTNTTRFTIPTSGQYLVNGYLEWASNATGERIIYLYANGVGIMQKSKPASALGSTGDDITALRFFTAGDYVEIAGYQNSGGNLNVGTNSFASIIWVGV